MTRKKKQIWTELELKGLLEDEDACVYWEKVQKHLSLHPLQLKNNTVALNEMLTTTLNFYDPKLDGFPLLYQNPKLVTDLGEQLSDICFIHIDIEVEYYIFRPAVGKQLKGIVTKKAINHIRVLVHRAFSVAIKKPPKSTDWVGDKVRVGQEIKFTVTHKDYEFKYPVFEGTLDPDTYLDGCQLFDESKFDQVDEKEQEGTPKKGKKKKMVGTENHDESLESAMQIDIPTEPKHKKIKLEKVIKSENATKVPNSNLSNQEEPVKEHQKSPKKKSKRNNEEDSIESKAELKKYKKQLHETLPDLVADTDQEPEKKKKKKRDTSKDRDASLEERNSNVTIDNPVPESSPISKDKSNQQLQSESLNQEEELTPRKKEKKKKKEKLSQDSDITSETEKEYKKKLQKQLLEEAANQEAQKKTVEEEEQVEKKKSKKKKTAEQEEESTTEICHSESEKEYKKKLKKQLLEQAANQEAQKETVQEEEQAEKKKSKKKKTVEQEEESTTEICHSESEKEYKKKLKKQLLEQAANQGAQKETVQEEEQVEKKKSKKKKTAEQEEESTTEICHSETEKNYKKKLHKGLFNSTTTDGENTASPEESEAEKKSKTELQNHLFKSPKKSPKKAKKAKNIDEPIPQAVTYPDSDDSCFSDSKEKMRKYKKALRKSLAIDDETEPEPSPKKKNNKRKLNDSTETPGGKVQVDNNRQPIFVTPKQEDAKSSQKSTEKMNGLNGLCFEDRLPNDLAKPNQTLTPPSSDSDNITIRKPSKKLKTVSSPSKVDGKTESGTTRPIKKEKD